MWKTPVDVWTSTRYIISTEDEKGKRETKEPAMTARYNPPTVDLDLIDVESDPLCCPEGYDAARMLEDEEEYYREQDERYEESHRCTFCTRGWCPHCQ
jgi:hypothetical protein